MLILLVGLLLLLALGGRGSSANSNKPGRRAGAGSIKAKGLHDSRQEQRSKLIESSRKAIIKTGFSERYFDEHFKLVEAFDKPGDLRVVWRFSLNGFETLVSDAMGYYTGARGKRTYVHSVTNTLGSTRDIKRTISKQRAAALMRSCLGRFMNETVVFMRLNTSDKTSLFLMAYSATRRAERRRNQDRSGARGQKNSAVDEVPQEDDEKERPISIGYINLETGSCSKGKASVAP